MHSALKTIARLLVPDQVRDWRARRWKLRVAAATTNVVRIANGAVLGGPFEGMRYLSRSHSSQLAPKLLGTYERELRDIVQGFCFRAYDRIVDVGAAEGYYAVGLLRLLPGAAVIAFEASAEARADLLHLATLNEVALRVDIRGRCESADLEGALAGAKRPVVVMDIDGGELEVLDPIWAPALRTAWILVELHPHFLPRVREQITARFRTSHRILYVPALDRQRTDLPLVPSLTTGDLLAAAWEAREDGQGWLWMEPLDHIRF